MAEYRMTKDNVKLVGRTYLRGDVLWCALSASGVKFVVVGDGKATIKLQGDSKAVKIDKNENCARVRILVNDVCRHDFMMDETEKAFILDVKDGDEVYVAKISESAMSTIGISMVETEGCEIKPAALKDKYVEIIGDSITCGYGVDDEDFNHNFRTETEDVFKSYSYKTVKALDVDYSMVCYSGYGIISGYTADPEIINDFETLPKHYEKLGYSIGESGVGEDKFKMTDIVWGFERKPELIIINLGTNDSSYCKTEEKANGYKELYVEFLKKVRGYNQNAKILCILGVMGDELFAKMCEAVEMYSKETGDTNIDTLHLDQIKAETEKYAADYHPTEKTHERVAGVVVEKARNIMGW